MAKDLCQILVAVIAHISPGFPLKAGQFWELKSIHLPAVKGNKHWLEVPCWLTIAGESGFTFFSTPKHGAMEQHIFVWALRFLSFLLPSCFALSLYFLYITSVSGISCSSTFSHALDSDTLGINIIKEDQHERNATPFYEALEMDIYCSGHRQYSCTE